jgi:hypothetical protein
MLLQKFNRQAFFFRVFIERETSAVLRLRGGFRPFAGEKVRDVKAERLYDFLSFATRETFKQHAPILTLSEHQAKRFINQLPGPKNWALATRDAVF